MRTMLINHEIENKIVRLILTTKFEVTDLRIFPVI